MAVSVGTMQQPGRVMIPVIVGGVLSLWMHALLPLLVGFAIAIVIAYVLGADWIRNGDH